MCGFLAGVLCFTLYLGVFSNGECHILKDWQNKVKSGKEERTIQGEQHVNKGCNISAGWNLTGRDLGCCGNYEGCCRMASRVCYLHDSICQCCRLGWIFCGPECKPETECLSTTEKWKTFSTNQSSSSTIISPSTNSSDMSSSMINKTDTSNQENETSSITSSSSDIANTSKENKEPSLNSPSSITSSSSDIANTSKENKEPSLNSSSNTANKTDFNQMEPDLGNEPTNQRSENRRKMPAFFNNTNSEKERVTQTMGEMENEFEFPLLKTYSMHNDIIEGSGEDG